VSRLTACRWKCQKSGKLRLHLLTLTLTLNRDLFRLAASSILAVTVSFMPVSRYTLTRRLHCGFSTPELVITVFLSLFLTASAFIILKPSNAQAQRDRAFNSLSQLLQVQDAQVLARGAPAHAADISASVPDIIWLESVSPDIQYSSIATSPTSVALFVSGASVFAAASFGDAGCVLVRREYTPSQGVAPVAWGVTESAVTCSPLLAASLAPQGSTGTAPNRPVVL
jgi:hypothetical protein